MVKIGSLNYKDLISHEVEVQPLLEDKKVNLFIDKIILW